MALLIPSVLLTFTLSLLAPYESNADNPSSGTTDKSQYLDVIEQELARLGLKAQCDRISLNCLFDKTLSSDGGIREVNVQFSPSTDTIYIYIKEYLTLGNADGLTAELARDLLAYNRELVTAKFEWDKVKSTIRLSTTINTDSNLDRRSLRSQIISLWSVADKLWPVLKKYQRPVATE